MMFNHEQKSFRIGIGLQPIHHIVNRCPHDANSAIGVFFVLFCVI